MIRRGAGALAGACLLMLAAALPARALVDLWSLSLSPRAMAAGVTTSVDATVTNLGALLASDIGCVTLTIPDAFAVNDTSVVDVPAGSSWNAGTSGGSSSRLARFRADADRDALGPGQEAVFRVQVVASGAGSSAWTGKAYAGRDCSGGLFLPMTIGITVTATPSPKPTLSPSPASTAMPEPTPTAAPTSTPTTNPTPTPTPTPIGTGPPTPVPDRSPRPGPTASAGPTPSPSATPSATPSPASTGSSAPVRSADPTPGGRAGSPGTAVSPGSNGGNGSRPGGHGPDDGSADAQLAVLVPEPDAGMTSDLGVSMDTVGLTLGMTWAVPGVAFGVSGLFLILAILAQAVGGAIWLPLVRRRIGSWGPHRRRA
jgi:hypothetical protein